MVNQNVLPSSTRLSTHSRPPCSSMRLRPAQDGLGDGVDEGEVAVGVSAVDDVGGIIDEVPVTRLAGGQGRCQAVLLTGQERANGALQAHIRRVDEPW